MSEFNPNANQERAAIRLASGWTARAAAKDVNVNEKTVARWKADPAFVELVQKRQSEIIGRTLGRLAGAAVRAVRTLEKCLASHESDNVKVRAALGILDQLICIRDTTELERRISELEATVNEQQS
jgi:hypothetical protein